MNRRERRPSRPIAEPGTAEMKVWSTEQIRAFLDIVRDDRLYAAWLLLATTGMRRGEVLGLRWRDVDLARRPVDGPLLSAHPRGLL